MNKTLFSVLISLILIAFVAQSVNAHGPSRQKVVEKVEISASPDKIWEIVKNFSDFSWNPMVKSASQEGSGVGSTRILKFDGDATITQALEKLVPEKKLISWRVKESVNEILAVNSYSAIIMVGSEENSKTTVTYKAAFYRGFMGNDPPEELNDANSKKKVIRFIKAGLEGLKKVAEK